VDNWINQLRMMRIMRYSESVDTADCCSDTDKFNDDVDASHVDIVSFENSIPLRFRNRDFPRDERQRKKICGSRDSGGWEEEKCRNSSASFFPREKNKRIRFQLPLRDVPPNSEV